MSGIFGVVSKGDCVETLFYGTDYHSHLGTEYGRMAVLGEDFMRQIHNISYTQFKSKFFEDCKRMEGNKGIGVIGTFDLEGHDIEDVSKYIDHNSDKYNKMVEWIRNDLRVTMLRYQYLEDMVAAIGLPKEKLCLYCWTGEYSKPKVKIEHKAESKSVNCY